MVTIIHRTIFLFPFRFFSGFFFSFSLSLPLLLMTFLRLKRPLKYGKELYSVNHRHLYQLARESLFKKELLLDGKDIYIRNGVFQKIEKISTEYNHLLQSAFLKFIPHEVWEFVITFKTGEEIRSKVRHGMFFSISTDEKIKREIKSFLFSRNIKESEIPL